VYRANTNQCKPSKSLLGCYYYVMIPFIKPRIVGTETDYIQSALSTGKTMGGGQFSKWCSIWLEDKLQAKKVLLTNSATAALEMAAMLLDIGVGDEIIMPSYTFSSSANAFVIRGATPVFIDVDPTTMNIDPELVASAITPKTKAILVVHYAGMSCDIQLILDICKQHDLRLIEDGAQSFLSTIRDQYLGTFGDLSCISFHSTKNVVSGEGGALVINNPEFIERAQILLEKGTNRFQFFNGQVDKYSWVDIGSSFVPSEVTAAYLKSQLEASKDITEYRIDNWEFYFRGFIEHEDELKIKVINPKYYSKHNGHIFFLILDCESRREAFIKEMEISGIICTSHYVPLHSSKAGIKFGRVGSSLKHSESLAAKLVRLPMWSEKFMPTDRILDESIKTLRKLVSFDQK
jgi:dTDP-4-amino-4,6-dideoxygalactose transaminase